MSGIAQGLPQRMTAFVDQRTGLVTDAWWRFLNSLWQRTGGAQPTSGIDDLIEWQNMADVPLPTPPDAGAWLGFLMGDAPTPPPSLLVYADPMGDVVPAPSPETAAWLATAMADAPPAVQSEVAAWLAYAMADVPRVPENDPALIAMMVS